MDTNCGHHVWPDKPRWASDGRTLNFLSRHHTGRFDLWGIEFVPDRGRPVGAPFRITDFRSADHTISRYYFRHVAGQAVYHRELLERSRNTRYPHAERVLAWSRQILAAAVVPATSSPRASHPSPAADSQRE